MIRRPREDCFSVCPANKAQKIVDKMRAAGIADAAVVGEVVKEHAGKIFVY